MLEVQLSRFFRVIPILGFRLCEVFNKAARSLHTAVVLLLSLALLQLDVFQRYQSLVLSEFLIVEKDLVSDLKRTFVNIKTEKLVFLFFALFKKIIGLLNWIDFRHISY